VEVAVEVAELVGGGELSLAGVVVDWLSFAGVSIMTVLVLVEVRPFWSVAT
jgi:branched-subunit amino acid transport protein